MVVNFARECSINQTTIHDEIIDTIAIDEYMNNGYVMTIDSMLSTMRDVEIIVEIICIILHGKNRR